MEAGKPAFAGVREESFFSLFLPTRWGRSRDLRSHQFTPDDCGERGCSRTSSCERAQVFIPIRIRLEFGGLEFLGKRRSLEEKVADRFSGHLRVWAVVAGNETPPGVCWWRRLHRRLRSVASLGPPASLTWGVFRLSTESTSGSRRVRRWAGLPDRSATHGHT